ncbi:MAG: BatA domain-containing protein [Planctomycetaceae bacterium]|nr:BatA domain-containing protein [Planctomycetaceae bacterium]
MLGFDSSLFALAGLAAAAGPVIIHLFNRRRFRVLPWAAMDFLREAIERHRRVLQIRDLILLALRVLAVVGVGLALARPYFLGGGFGTLSGLLFLLLCGVAAISAAASAVLPQRNQQRLSLMTCGVSSALLLSMFGWIATRKADETTRNTTARSPVHAIVIIDNSRSMGVTETAGTRLDRAKRRVETFFDSLPPDSRFSLIPLAGSVETIPEDPLRSKEDARRTLARLQLVDAAGTLSIGLDAAVQASQQTLDLPVKRIVLVSDLQTTSWKEFDWTTWSQQLPGLQIAPVASEPVSNVWIAGLALEDGIAGIETPVRITANVQAEGPHATTSVQAVLTVDGMEVGSQAIELTPGQSREVEFIHQFEVAGEPGRPHWSQVSLEVHAESLGADQLPADNRATLLAPVVAALPVVFVDQYGDQEDITRKRIGETYALRHLLAPRLATEAVPRRLIQVQHVRPEQLTQELLETARMVVIAGVESPASSVALLREYVLQGGPCVILAGGEFNPREWQDAGWLDGNGLLPCPLESTLKGHLPDSATELQPFFVDFSSLQHDDFLIAGEDPQLMSGLFSATPFFQAVVADCSPEAVTALRLQMQTRMTDDLRFLQDFEALKRSGTSASDSSAMMLREQAEQRYQQLEPAWWQWRSPLPLWDRSRTAADLAEQSLPRVLAAFDADHLPWVIERRFQAGKVVFFTSGVSSDWNLLRASGAMYVFHRILHRLMEETFPRRNFASGERIALPLASWTDGRYAVERPGGVRETVAVEALSADVSGLVVRRPLTSGFYRIDSETTSEEPHDSSVTSPNRKDLLQLAVQAPESESPPACLTPYELQQQIGNAEIRVLAVDEPILVSGGHLRGQGLWRWLVGGVIGALLLEMLIAGGVTRKSGGEA